MCVLIFLGKVQTEPSSTGEANTIQCLLLSRLGRRLWSFLRGALQRMWRYLRRCCCRVNPDPLVPVTSVTQRSSTSKGQSPNIHRVAHLPENP